MNNVNEENSNGSISNNTETVIEENISQNRDSVQPHKCLIKILGYFHLLSKILCITLLLIVFIRGAVTSDGVHPDTIKAPVEFLIPSAELFILSVMLYLVQ